MQRYFIKQAKIFNNQITMSSEDSYHINKVMRMKIGDQIIIIVDERITYLAKILMLNPITRVEIIKEIENNNELPINVTIAHGLIRREKMEDVIEKLTELGTYAYYPVIMKRSSVKYFEERFDKRIERFERIVKEASEQSRRLKLMNVSLPIKFNELLTIKKDFDYALFAYEDEEINSNNFKTIMQKKPSSLLIVIGPEGGYDLVEVQQLIDWGFIPISLGPRILRTEVAPLYLVSAISYEIELGEKNDKS